MKTCVWHDLPKFKLTSYGNGLAFELANKSEGKAVFFQGDDAEIFRASYEALTEGRAQLSFADALGCIWSDYAECADNWGIR